MEASGWASQQRKNQVQETPPGKPWYMCPQGATPAGNAAWGWKGMGPGEDILDVPQTARGGEPTAMGAQ